MVDGQAGPGEAAADQVKQVQDFFGSRLLTVAGAGHGLVIEQPEIVSDAVRDFILQAGDA